jgi:hypothetical protein
MSRKQKVVGSVVAVVGFGLLALRCFQSQDTVPRGAQAARLARVNHAARSVSNEHRVRRVADKIFRDGGYSLMCDVKGTCALVVSGPNYSDGLWANAFQEDPEFQGLFSTLLIDAQGFDGQLEEPGTTAGIQLLRKFENAFVLSAKAQCGELASSRARLYVQADLVGRTIKVLPEGDQSSDSMKCYHRALVELAARTEIPPTVTFAPRYEIRTR